MFQKREGETTLEPSVRGHYMKVFAAEVDRLAAPERDRVRSAAAGEVWRAITASGAFNWLPFEVNLACTHAVSNAMTPEKAHLFFQRLLLSTSRTPLLEGLIQGVLRTLGGDPGASLPWVARGFELMFKDCGTWRVAERSTSFASLEVTGLPFSAASDPVWLESVASSLSALFTLASLTGKSELHAAAPMAQRAVFRLTW